MYFVCFFICLFFSSFSSTPLEGVLKGGDGWSLINEEEGRENLGIICILWEI